MNASSFDTIAAVATPAGRGGIGIIRVSGKESHAVLERMFIPAEQNLTDFVPWKLHRGRITDSCGRTLDDALAVFMPGPRTFTGEDVAELHCHGGVSLLAAVLDEVLKTVRLAERGEFSRRAFLNGRMDLSRAEAVLELIDAPTKEGARLAAGKLHGLLATRVEALSEKLEILRSRICLAVDFPDDEVPPLPTEDFLRGVYEVLESLERLLAGVERSRCWREGITVAIAGSVNAGKSSLLNALLGRDRAIVTDRPGTTRDFLEESIVLDGLSAKIIDTAGLRSTVPDDMIEAEGIKLGLERVREADAVILLIDGERGITAETALLAAELDPQGLILAWNKSDTIPPTAEFTNASDGIICAERCVLSAKNGDGIDCLARLVRKTALRGRDEPAPDDVAPNARQAAALTEAKDILCALIRDIESALPYELCAVRIEEASRALGSIIGRGTADDVLNRIFETFCIGK